MLHHKTLRELAEDLHNKEYSSLELTDYFLARIKKIDGNLNSFITVTEEVARQQAMLTDEKRAQKNTTLTYLAGIPIAHKDNFCTKNIKTSCGSKMLDNFVPPYSAAIVEKLEQAGCVLLGKTNMDEFAMGSSTEQSYYGVTKNPWNMQCVPGGSSGGAAAAVAARLTPCATGSDTGGSIRQPAAFCGVTGLKPTYGLASRYGMIAFASSLDQAGILALSAEDAAMLLTFMAGLDGRDATSADVTIPDYTKALNNSLHGLKIGVPKEYFNEEANPKVALALEEAMTTFKKLGASLIAITLPHLNLSIPTYHIIASAECSSNLARYDGVRYGYRCANPKDWRDLYVRSRSEGFGTEAKRRIMTGTYVLSTGFYEDFYLQAQKVRSLIKEDFYSALKKADIIISPTTPSTAFKIGERVSDPVNMYLSDMYTAPVSLCGLPAISIPVGFLKDLPVGMQLIGNCFGEKKLLNVAHQYQLVTDWHRKAPDCCYGCV